MTRYKIYIYIYSKGFNGKSSQHVRTKNNVSRGLEILRKNQKRNTRDQNTVTEIKNAFDGLINRLDMAEERISELQDISTETLKTKKQREKKE